MMRNVKELKKHLLLSKCETEDLYVRKEKEIKTFPNITLLPDNNLNYREKKMYHFQIDKYRVAGYFSIDFIS